MTLEYPPIATTEMLIRRPVSEVFEAFVDPAVTSRFWFTRSSGRLEAGRKVSWEWEMYGVGTELTVAALEKDSRIVIEWDDPPTRVEWTFTARPDGTTFVRVANTGFVGTGDEMVRQAIDSTGGFTLVLAGAKALLEHGIELDLVADHSPDAP
jgi:uncharacterized protein YndB with AHSA1/START domain